MSIFNLEFEEVPVTVNGTKITMGKNSSGDWGATCEFSF